VTYGGTVAAATVGAPRYHIPGQYAAEFGFAQTHPDVIAAAQKYSAELTFAQTHPDIVATATRLGPELAAIQAHLPLFLQLQANPTNRSVIAQAEAAVGPSVFAKIAANGPAIQSVFPFSTQLTALASVPPSVFALVTPYASQLGALAKVPPSVIAYVTAHGAAVGKAAANTANQWKHWYWICFGCMIAFLLTVPLMRGHWSPKKAKAEEDAHEAMVQAELAKLAEAGATA
jgi:hypothetical protein